MRITTRTLFRRKDSAAVGQPGLGQRSAKRQARAARGGSGGCRRDMEAGPGEGPRAGRGELRQRRTRTRSPEAAGAGANPERRSSGRGGLGGRPRDDRLLKRPCPPGEAQFGKRVGGRKPRAAMGSSGPGGSAADVGQEPVGARIGPLRRKWNPGTGPGARPGWCGSRACFGRAFAGFSRPAGEG
jgi:hypothetical protein